MKVQLTDRGTQSAMAFMNQVWAVAIERTPSIRFQLVEAIEHIIETYLKLGKLTEWEAMDEARANHILRLEEDVHFVLIDRGRTFETLIHATEEFHRTTGGGWSDWEDAEAILRAFGPDYHDDHIPWKRAEILLNRAIMSNGRSLSEPTADIFKWAPLAQNHVNARPETAVETTRQ